MDGGERMRGVPVSFREGVDLGVGCPGLPVEPPSRFTLSEWKTVPALWGDPCSYCGGAAGTIDHIVPRDRGGELEWQNLTAACKRCNSSKGVRPLLHHLLDTSGAPVRPGQRRQKPERRPKRRAEVVEYVAYENKEGDVLLPIENIIEAMYQNVFPLTHPAPEDGDARKAVIRSFLDLAKEEDEDDWVWEPVELGPEREPEMVA